MTALQIQVMALDCYKNGARLNRLMQFQPFPSDNWIANDNADYPRLDKNVGFWLVDDPLVQNPCYRLVVT